MTWLKYITIHPRINIGLQYIRNTSEYFPKLQLHQQEEYNLCEGIYILRCTIVKGITHSKNQEERTKPVVKEKHQCFPAPTRGKPTPCVSAEWPPLVEYACGQRTDSTTNHTTSHAHVPPRVITTQPTPAELKTIGGWDKGKKCE